jgi:hypothetical protein
VFKAGFLRRFVKPISIFLIINIVGIGSWMVRNKIKFDYFGISILMPYQLRHYTKHFFHKYREGDDELLNRCAEIFLEEGCDAGRFDRRLQTEMNMDQVEISEIFMKMNIKVIRDNPGEYLRQVPNSARDYYRNYSATWMVPFNKVFLSTRGLMPRLFRFFFDMYSFLYKNLLSLLSMIVVLPVVAIICSRKNKEVFHLLMLIEGSLTYNFLISILSTNSGIDNLRYRVPVESMILIMTFSGIYFSVKCAGDFARGVKNRTLSK